MLSALEGCDGSLDLGKSLVRKVPTPKDEPRPIESQNCKRDGTSHLVRNPPSVAKRSGGETHLLDLQTSLNVQAIREDDNFAVERHAERVVDVLRLLGVDERVSRVLSQPSPGRGALCGEVVEENFGGEGVGQGDVERRIWARRVDCFPEVERASVDRVITLESGDAHRPLVGDRSDRHEIVLLRKVHVRCPRESTSSSASLELDLLIAADETLHDEVVDCVRPATAGAKFGEGDVARNEFLGLCVGGICRGSQHRSSASEEGRRRREENQPSTPSMFQSLSVWRKYDSDRRAMRGT